MKKIDMFLIGLAVLALMGLLSSCSAIPTLPPLESTVIIEVPTKVQETAPAVTQVVVEPTSTQAAANPPASATAPPAETAAPTEEPTRAPTETEPPAPTATATQPPTATAKPTRTPTRMPTRMPTDTPEPTATEVVYDYRLQAGSPSYLANFAHPEDGCDWLGVAGHAFNGEGEALKQLVVKATGTLNGKALIDQMALTGSAAAYGPGGYELQLGDSPAETSGEVKVQLFDLDGNPLSDQVALDTYDSCGLNLILVNFQEK